jgi:hypothetical protein
MKKNIIKVLLPLFTFLFVNCKKDDTIMPLNDTFIIIPSNEFVKIEELDSTYVKYDGNFFDELLIDVDRDGFDDFKLLSSYTGSAGGIREIESYIEVLNHAYKISVINITDTTRACISPINDTVNFTTYYNNYSNFLCNSQSTDTIAYINSTTHPRIYSTGDTVSQSGIWEGGKMTLSYYDYSTHFFSAYSIIKGNWNNQNMKYLVFNKDGTDEFGWIKLSIVGHNEIQVHEIARPK